MQAQVMRDLAVTGYVGTPTFLLNILEKAIEIASDPAWPMAELGAAYREMGKVEKARDTLEKAVELNPNDADASVAQALLAVYGEDGETARRALAGALEAFVFH